MDAHRRSLAILGLSTSLLVAACGGGGAATSGPGGPAATGGGPATQAPDGVATQAPGGAQTVDACTLLSDAEIEEVTGNKVASKEPAMQSGLLDAGCHWVLENADSLVPPEINLEVMFEGGLDYYKRYFEPFNAEYGYEAIEGVGDIAVDADFGSILVVSGDAFFDLQDLAFGSEKNNAEALARKVVANLGR